MGFRTYTCPIARSCGGCEWLAVPYPIQLRRKREAVVELFSDVLAELPTSETRRRQVPIHGMDVDGMEPVHFRHKAATPFAPGSGEAIRSGFYARGTHRIVPCADCLVEAPGARRVLSAVARAAEELRIPAYEEDRGRGLLRHAVVRMGFATNECLLTVVTNGRGIACEREFVQHILTHAPEVTAIAQNVNHRRTNAILGRETLALYGGGHMVDQLLDVSFEIGPTSFYQTNPAQTEVLYDLAIRGAGLEGGMHVLDAYCGIGTIGLTASDKARQVVGVEVNRDAVRDAIGNAKHNGVKNARFFAADATAWIREAADAGQKADVVFMDPPREGSTPAFLESVARMAPKRIVYVSCNPETMARDLALLTQKGYRAEGFTPVDMFPHSAHCEVVGSLVRVK